MLNLDELFKKHPFIYLVDDVYYAFGAGVCAKCNNNVEHITLPLRYQRYMEALKRDDISPQEAWEIFRKLVFVANVVRDTEEHLHLKEQFGAMDFSDFNKSEIEIQLRNMVQFFQKYNLHEFYK